MLALERRRLGNRSRWEGPGNARDGAANGAETSFVHTARAGAVRSSGITGIIALDSCSHSAHGDSRLV